MADSDRDALRGILSAARPGFDDVAHAVFAAASSKLFAGSAAHPHVGRYVLIERIGKGGMGEVFRAHDPSLDRSVAVKLMSVHSQLGAARLLREARAMAALSHPNILPVYDVGMYESGAFIAMELVEGQTLRQWIGAEQRQLSEIVTRFALVGRGLAAAHEAGLVHRDFKPDNVMCGDELASVRVMDFGLAKSVGTADNDSSGPAGSDTDRDLALTRSDVVLGTPVYMSPEQHERGEVGPASDQYSFCVSLFEAVCRRLPFVGASARELAAAKFAAKVRWPEEQPPPKWLRALLLRGLAPQPADRWPSMASLIDELERKRVPRLAIPLLGLAAAGVLLVLSPIGWTKLRRWTSDDVVSPAQAAMPERLQIAVELGQLEVLTRAGHYDDAALAAAALVERAEATQHEPTAVAVLNALAQAESGAGRFEAAEQHALDAFHRAEAVGLSGAQVVAATTLANVVAYRAPAEARTWVRHGLAALERSELVRVLDHVELLSTSGRVYAAVGDWPAAITDYQAALSLLDAMPEPDALALARVLSGLGGAEFFAEAHDEAEEHSQRALELLVDALGPEHPFVAESLSSNASILLRRGREREGIALLERALALQEASLGPDHHKLARTLDWLAHAHMQVGDYERGLPFSRRAVQIGRRTVQNSRDFTAYLNNLAALCLYTERWEEALAALQEAVSVYETSEPGTERFVQPIEINIGVALQRLGRHAEAVDLYRRLVDEDPHDGVAWAGLGESQLALGHEAETRAAFEVATRELADNPARAEAVAFMRTWLAQHAELRGTQTAP